VFVVKGLQENRVSYQMYQSESGTYKVNDCVYINPNQPNEPYRIAWIRFVVLILLQLQCVYIVKWLEWINEKEIKRSVVASRFCR
jgi:hypothetical protein